MDNQIYLDLIEKAKYARVNAYAPYSNYKVGAALLCSDGSIYKGANIENSAYSETVCAERVAFYNAISKEGDRRDFKAIAIVGGKGTKISDFAFPCGACRQVMSEFCSEKFEIILYNGNDIEVYALKDLLPNVFSAKNIK
ncbi:MAG: cytidine deaminase [Clostridia bacterium]|nr:cytidine deaminase [Clostridia bacterium]